MSFAARVFVRTMLIPAAAAVTLMFAAPVASADTCPVSLAFEVQPTTTQVQTAMTPAVVVDVENSEGYLATDFEGQVTLSYAVNNVGAPLPANNVVDAVNGVATFSDLTFSAVGFGFELEASIGGGTASPPSQQFDIVTQLVHCQPGQACQTGTVSSTGTSGSAMASAASTSDVMTATGGGFPSLSCTTTGGVVSFTVTDRSKVITMMLAKSLVEQAPNPGAAHFNICWGSPTPFITQDGATSAFNQVTGEYEGLLPDCSAGGPSPCITSRNKTNAGVEIITIAAPAGDPHISF